MTAILLSVLAAFLTLAIVVAFLRLPRIQGEEPDERVAAVTIDLTTRMETMRRELTEALEAARREAERHRFLEQLASARDLETVLRRTLETAGALTASDGALVEAAGERQRRIMANLGLSADEARRLSLAGPPDGKEPQSMFLSYQYDSEDPAGVDRICAGVAVVLPGEMQPVGRLTVFSRSPERGFSDDEVRELEAFAARAGPAIESARVMHEARGRADVDPLTGLPGRRSFRQALARAVTEVRRSRHALTLLLLNLDAFRRVNLRFGHRTGDAILARVADRLGAAVADGAVSRTGGDEFGIILRGASALDAQGLCERLEAAVVSAGEPELPDLSFSAGIAEIQPGEEAESLFQRADDALYRAQSGRNPVVIG